MGEGSAPERAHDSLERRLHRRSIGDVACQLQRVGPVGFGAVVRRERLGIQPEVAGILGMPALHGSELLDRDEPGRGARRRIYQALSFEGRMSRRATGTEGRSRIPGGGVHRNYGLPQLEVALNVEQGLSVLVAAA